MRLCVGSHLCNYNDMTGNTNKIIENISSKTDKCILFFSCGKDSIVCLDYIYPKFNTIHCVFMYFVKDLEHINRWIRWAKVRYPKIIFYQCPHFALTHIMRKGIYCTPNPKIKQLSLSDIVRAMRAKFNCEYVFTGMKKADSMTRRVMLMTYEKNNYENKGMVYPLAEWTNKEILAYMKQRGLPEPVRYSKKSGGGVGFEPETFIWLRENFPQDLEKIYAAFPFSRRILFEYNNQIDNDE